MASDPPDMELVPCNEASRQVLAETLCQLNDNGAINKKAADYVARTFPSILLDIARLITEQATQAGRQSDEPSAAILNQLKPFMCFSTLLGKCPQVTSLIYSYFQKSSFQPLPDNLFQWDSSNSCIVYNYPGFTDELVLEILTTYFKYLTFNPKWFSSVWNWSELGRFISLHTNTDIRYIAACCLSIITRPSRTQHISFIRDVIGPENHQELIDLQIKHRSLYYNTYKPCIETRVRPLADDYVKSVGYSETGYVYCSKTLAKVANILLLKRDLSRDEERHLDKYNRIIKNYVCLPTMNETISRIAYSLSLGRPCLLRGRIGSGKTAILDYIAAHTYRSDPPHYIKVQIGDQIDSKMLIGSYVCTEIAGQFDWQPGPLTKAMYEGSWIVFEDIDTAPSDMLQVIHSVIENGNLSCVASCPIKLDSPHPDFRIIFTQQVSRTRNMGVCGVGKGFVERLCDVIDVPDFLDEDLVKIIEARFSFGQLSETILKIFRACQETLANESTKSSRVITLRDLIKYCEYASSARSNARHDTVINMKDIEFLLLDAVDCYLRCLPEPILREHVPKVGKLLTISSDDVDKLIFSRIPQFKSDSREFSVGRSRIPVSYRDTIKTKSSSPIANTKHSLQLLESIARAIYQREPVLLVGETGVGKTSIVQNLANQTGSKLCVLNLSQQTDSADLLGGYKPVEMREILRPLHSDFDLIFRDTFDLRSNEAFLQQVNQCFINAKKNSQWSVYLKLICRLCGKALNRNDLDKSKMEKWSSIMDRARRFSKRIAIESEQPAMALKFLEGSLLKAVREGFWLLLDEINLAEPDVLQCLILVLDSIKESKLHMWNIGGDQSFLEIHRNFRIFACMNPSTDIGKRDLALSIRVRFTEIFVDDIDDPQELRLIVGSYISSCLKPTFIEKIVQFYREVRVRAKYWNDVSGNAPVYSLRTLCRALAICSNNVCPHTEKSLYESLKITFLQQLNDVSTAHVIRLIEQTIFNETLLKGMINFDIPVPKDQHQYVNVQGFWIQQSSEPICADENYILTKSVERNLENLARIISMSQRKLPILIQGNTSVGKTSLINYLAKLTGNRCYRINNHEHTDLQEYVGRYVLKESGDLVFQEGLLARAMKRGYWLILDELNLAPSELLEALNRVLDDNREFFVPETGEVIKVHSKFILFATQNPPEKYSGRKLLSRAFRNRFIELHFDEIPRSELEHILEKRCQLSPKHSKKIVSVMRELQLFRRESGCFDGKESFMTMRDLFRWGERYARSKDDVKAGTFFDWDAYIAGIGLVLLEGRVRTVGEAEIVKSIIEKNFNCQLDRESIYNLEAYEPSRFSPQLQHIYFSKEFKRFFFQMKKALEYKEPVLLCGQTGCGKTTACQLFSELEGNELMVYNCHANTESSDFTGSVRPSRSELEEGETRKQTFPWCDGPLVTAMKKGTFLLLDEISLADDAVLERINSVLEPERSITLTEKNGEIVFAKDSFRLLATMNPGGDFGKKELSPALRNRFTEIYCHNTSDLAQIQKIIENSLSRSTIKSIKLLSNTLTVMLEFLGNYYQSHETISIRDVLSWSKFISETTKGTNPRPLSMQEALINGASLVFFDQFGTCGHSATKQDVKSKSILKQTLSQTIMSKFGSDPVYVEKNSSNLDLNTELVRFKKFFLNKGPEPIFSDAHKEFVIDAPNVKRNILKLVRAMQLDKPILLEGDPGSGKTSIVMALAKLTGHKLVRINLSEQTDIGDLFGSDLPDVDCDDDNPTFSWRDGPILEAIKQSHWILLDEMNLASQSVLEGLNACLDHRGEIYIAELNATWSVDRSTTRIFACQNPHSQGASRKGLPQSFLNRFTSIFIEPHNAEDLITIISKTYPNMPIKLIIKMVEFNLMLNSSDLEDNYEFNLRDLMYWCHLTTRYVRIDASENHKVSEIYRPDKFAQFVYQDRLRSQNDKNSVNELFKSIFSSHMYEPPYRDIRLGEHSLIIARSILPRKTRVAPHLPEVCLLKYQLPYLESVAKAIEFNKMPILVGEDGVGKRTLVKILAGLTGNQLNILGANREMDTVELLGSFEQQSLQRRIVDLIEESRTFMISLINSNSYKHSETTWSQLFKRIWITLYATFINDQSLTKSEMMDAFRLQLVQMNDLLGKIQPWILPNSCQDTKKQCEDLMKKIHGVTQKFLFNSESMYSSGNFEWVDSILVNSIRNGSWLLIENANLLNPATLDRLNSLVEPDGTLSLNEKGSGHVGIEIIKPHKDFRLILTMNAEHGELSRAMRNRGVEISVQTRFFFEDFLLLLNQNGFEPEEKKACMTYCIMQTSYDFHKKVTCETPEEDGHLLAHFSLNHMSDLTHHIRRSKDVDKILGELLISYYYKKGLIEESNFAELTEFTEMCMNENKQKYLVSLVDERYKWMNMQHDFVALTGGDANTIAVDRDNRLFYDDFNLEMLLKEDEMIENIDIVNTCVAVKIFLEQASHGDFEYRKGFIRETFLAFPSMMEAVNHHVELLHDESVPLIDFLTPRFHLASIKELPIDSRNHPELHDYLVSLDNSGTVKRRGLQNRWILSLHRIMLNMIIKLVEERTMEVSGNLSLWGLSEKVRAGEMLKEDLIRPAIEIAVEIYDLLMGLLRVVCNRCFDDFNLRKMLPRFFWLHYMMCKLKRGYNKVELVGVSNQLPMLWSLTYQKIITPLVKDCNISDITYKGKKFSSRLDSISNFLESALHKPSLPEKNYYRKVLNMNASTTKLCETLSREVDRFFTLLIARYNSRSQALFPGSENVDTLAASTYLNSMSTYMKCMYDISEKLFIIELAEKTPSELRAPNMAGIELRYFDSAQGDLITVKNEFDHHESMLKNPGTYKDKFISSNRRRLALDQFAPIWQIVFIQTKFSSLDPEGNHPGMIASLKKTVRNINGIIISPRYYYAILKYMSFMDELRRSGDPEDQEDVERKLNETTCAYTAFLVEHLHEYTVLDHQVVGWTKLRVTTCDLPTLAPMIPEYCPMISHVSGYSLDISHLKLNSYSSSSTQLDLTLIYLWRRYSMIKNVDNNDNYDMKIAQNLIHIRRKLTMFEDPLGSYECEGSHNCACVETYIGRQDVKSYELIKRLEMSLLADGAQTIIRSVKLISFGKINCIEYAPIFTLDPALRSREKLEVYKSELAHIKLDLQYRNTLYYWKTGENLQLNEIDPEEASSYPFSTLVLIERRAKLERVISKLKSQHTSRPKTDDGSSYYELRREVESSLRNHVRSIDSVFDDLLKYCECRSSESRSRRLTNLVSRCRMLIKSISRTINHLKTQYALYSDLTTHYIVGLCLVHQGFRCLYANLERTLQMNILNLGHSVNDTMSSIMRVFSSGNLVVSNMESVHLKLNFLKTIDKICPVENSSEIQSVLLRTILMQLNHHIMITPSDIERCIPIVHRIADLFHTAWLKRKIYLEEQRQQREAIYQYKASRTTIGGEIPYERQEFLDICTKFPTYDHVFQSHYAIEPTSAEKENLATEEQLNNLSRSVDMSMCIDICKAHYKFIREASRNLLCGHVNPSDGDRLPLIDLSPLVKLEAQAFYTIVRHCIPILDSSFDSMSVECHLLQADELIKTLRHDYVKSRTTQTDTLKNSIEILDQEIFDIYHDSNAHEALKFQELVTKVDDRVQHLRKAKGIDNHPSLNAISKLTTRISAFLITDPMMKFVTGSHALLDKLEAWNNQSIPKEDKILEESNLLVDLIKHWRSIEIESWKGSLHKVKRKYIDSSLCDLWFQLYEAFKDPLAWVRSYLQQRWGDQDSALDGMNEDRLYEGFISFIMDFIESGTMGDYQIRLDLVFTFAIQTRFASLYEQSLHQKSDRKNVKLDYEKLTIYVYNYYKQMQGFLTNVKHVVDREEAKFSQELKTEMRIVAWQGRNLWEMKNNYRISHRKLNKVMNKYLDFLKGPLMPTRPSCSRIDPVELIESEKISITLSAIQILVDQARVPMIDTKDQFSALTNATKIVHKLKDIYKTVFQDLTSKHVEVLCRIEDSIREDALSIECFSSHKVEQVIIKKRDTDDVKKEKQKLCRQMYNSKKFAIQSIFKSLQRLGVSYQRGLNNQDALDRNILVLEPLRGLIQNKNRRVLKNASGLVNDEIIISCNEKYQELIPMNMYLLSQSGCEDLTTDQKERIRGLAFDTVLDIIKHYKNAAHIYSNLMDIQAATARLTELHDLDKSTIYNFDRVHKSVEKFDRLVGITYLALAKIEKLANCYSTALEIESDTERSIVEDGSDEPKLIESSEGITLSELINEKGEEYSLMTREQYNHFNFHLNEVRKNIVEVSQDLRDMLNNTSRNYLYGDDDVDHLNELHEKFHESLEKILPSRVVQNEQLANVRAGTVLHAIKVLLNESITSLKPKLSKEYFKGETGQVMIDESISKKLDIRIHKLIRQIKLAAQGIYQDEIQFKSGLDLGGEAARRRSKPFNFLNSCTIKASLRLETIAKLTGNCFKTLNRHQVPSNVNLIVSNLGPILFIYVQTVASYLNVILSALNLKLMAANQLLPFFTDVTIEGFGLPTLENLDEADPNAQAKLSEDNTGFGDGQGDKDVTKKLEFESQLDDLQNQDGHQDDGDKDVEAHDDGVEMSDDIDAEAQGPEKRNDTDENRDDEDSAEDEDDLDELEKQMGHVDDDEEKLDEKIWSDADEAPDEDDEEDLKETSVEDGLQPEIEDTELQANDQGVNESTNDRGADNKDNMTVSDSDDGADDHEESSEKKGTEDPEEMEDDSQELNLEEEAAQAQRESDGRQDDDKMDETEQPGLEDLLAEDESQIDEETETNDDLRDERSSAEQDSADATLDDDIIHEQLENALDESNKLEDPIQETIRNAAKNVDEQAAEGRQELKGEKSGGFSLYNVIPEDENDPIDVDDLNANQDDSADKMNEDPMKANSGENDDSRGEARTEAQAPDSEQKVSEPTSPSPPAEGKSSKRTLAERDISLPDDAEIKRPKICESLNSTAELQIDVEDDNDTSTEAEDVSKQSQVEAARHVEKDNSDAVEVIDLCDSDEDPTTVDSNDQQLEVKFSPNDAPKPKTRESQSTVPEIIREEGVNQDNPSPPKSPGPENDKADDGLSSISSYDDMILDYEEPDFERSRPNLQTLHGTNSSALQSQTMKDSPDLSLHKELIDRIDQELSKIDQSRAREHDSIDADRLKELWIDCTRKTNHLVQELCHELQIVLQPTKMSKYKGDYKSGKRLNMRKIISYIASQYRKDKIWLRRTKPSKRTYNITIAVDNSSSMSENNCRHMTYQSLALLAKSLSMIEAGSLSVVSFGEKVKCILDFEQPYFDAIGAQWLRELRFNEKRTSYKQLLGYSVEAFDKQVAQRLQDMRSNSVVSQLLVIISDGRNVSGEEEEVKSYLKHLKSMGVLTLFIIIDDLNRNEQKSIVDVQRCVGFGSNIKMVSYMELFPFPFYVILRKLETMPSVLGDALRQWFELVRQRD